MPQPCTATGKIHRRDFLFTFCVTNFYFSHLSIEKNLQWNLYDTSLLHNDSIVVLGKSIKVSLNRTITIDGSQFILELTLLWTPMRKLVRFCFLVSKLFLVFL